MHSLFLLKLSLCYQETCSFWSLSLLAHAIPNWLKWSLLSSVLTFFLSWSLLRLTFIKSLSQQLLQPALLLLARANSQVNDTVTACQDVKKYTCAFLWVLMWLATAILYQQPLNSFKNLTKKKVWLGKQRANREKWLFYKVNRFFFFFWYVMVSYEEKSHIQINNNNEDKITGMRLLFSIYMYWVIEDGPELYLFLL